MMKKIPTQTENPTGLHQRYEIRKIVPMSMEDIERRDVFQELTIPPGVTSKPTPAPKFKSVEVDAGAEYFVFRLDEGGKDPEHIKACRIGVHAYADAIQHHLPELANDLKTRYPLLP